MRSRRLGAPLPALFALSLSSLLACGDAAKPAAAPATPVAATVDASAPAADVDAAPPVAALPANVPDTPAGHQLAWVLGSFLKPPAEVDVAPHFTPDFTAQISIAQIVELFAKVGSDLAPLAVEHVEDGGSPTRFTAIAHSEKTGAASGAKMRISLVVEDGEPHRIAGLTFRPVIATKPVASWADVQGAVRAVAPSAGFLAAEIVGNKCTPIASAASVDPKKALALGSASKLYVLDALAKQISLGKHKWDETIAIDDAKKSDPPGDLRNEPAGRTFTVEQLATKMIAAGDNTATDHLLAFVGRPAVEDIVKTSGNTAAARDVPFLSTRDVASLKRLGSPDELKAYVAADANHRRKLLTGFEARDLAGAGNAWDRPRMIDSIEWFSSPEDLCKLVAQLKEYADAAATTQIGAILSLNPGIPPSNDAFKYIGFKGGSEPGVMNFTWLLQRKKDDKWLFLTLGFNDTSANIDQGKAIAAATAARDFLGQ